MEMQNVVVRSAQGIIIRLIYREHSQKVNHSSKESPKIGVPSGS